MYFAREPLVTRLGRLADSGQTGALRVPGDFGGTIYLDEGRIVYAESRRTPAPDRGLVRPGAPGWGYAVREATVDAALELLSGRPRPALRQPFRETEKPDVGEVSGMSYGDLLTEVERRQGVLSQLADHVTADTTVTRNAPLDVPRVQVSELQWALLVRVGDKATPRELAWEIGHSVFSTTVEVFRLLVLRLLASASGTVPQRDTLSFLRAVTE
ncbi:DUF4388 domain-containing protein [Actinocorallia populi]|uniref:DUF4388 domain-containing protein n=1 Tax=Actinocorallia populi TaxID=2079200 RepID=UPI000D092312|nr:DUF4388 domain-containing protein [Actinocorallia populi]